MRKGERERGREKEREREGEREREKGREKYIRERVVILRRVCMWYIYSC